MCKSEIKSSLDKEGIKHVRFSAVDGYKIKIRRENGEIFTGLDLKNGKKFRFGEKYTVYCPNVSLTYKYSPSKEIRQLTAGELGIYCSHVEIWQDIMNNKYRSALVLEDDAKIESGFSSSVKNITDGLFNIKKWDILFLTHVAGTKKPFQLFMKFKPVFRANELQRITDYPIGVASSHAYITNYYGVANIINQIKLYQGIDVDTSRLIRKGKLNAYRSAKINVLQDSESVSIIKDMGRKF